MSLPECLQSQRSDLRTVLQRRAEGDDDVKGLLFLDLSSARCASDAWCIRVRFSSHARGLHYANAWRGEEEKHNH
jgi:hypothetical protein